MNYHLFDDILKQINNDKIRDFTIKCLEKVDPIIEKIPASSSGKFHPPECNTEGGLIKHIQRTCYFANTFFNSFQWSNTEIKADIVLSALLLHDIGKKEKYVKYWDYVDHPITAAKMISEFKSMLDEKIFNTIRDCVKWHMGVFSPKSIKKDIKDFTLLQLITYESDFLASKKELSILV